MDAMPIQCGTNEVVDLMQPALQITYRGNMGLAALNLTIPVMIDGVSPSRLKYAVRGCARLPDISFRKPRRVFL